MTDFTLGGQVRAICIAFALALVSTTAVAATTDDISVSAYTWTPDPVAHGGVSTFTIVVTNNDNFAGANGLSLAVQLPANVDFSTATTSSSLPAGCALGGGATTLSCTKATLVALATWTVTFDGVGGTQGVQNTTATAAATGNTDPNPGNDTLTKAVTVIDGADLTLLMTGTAGCTSACSTTAGSTYSFPITVTNNGPDAATTFRVTVTLPATTDFTYQSFSGTGWSCSAAGTTLTCNYSGSSVAAAATAPLLTVTGRVITSSASISTSAIVASTDASVPDTSAANNGPSTVTLAVTPGTNLTIAKTMTSVATGLTTFVASEAVTLRLQATNSGTQSASGVTISDTVPADFTLGAMPGGCSKAGQVITCSPGTLAAGASSTNYSIPLTVVASPTTGSGSNTATSARSSPAGGSNGTGTANYTISPPFAHLTIAKTKTPSLQAAGSNFTNTITVTNSSTSTNAATGTIRATDVLDPNETFVSASGTGWSCSGLAVGATGTLTCDYAGANLARGSSLPSITLVTQAAPGYLGSVANTACTGLSASSPHLPADNSSTGNCQTRSAYSTPRNVDLTVAKVASIASPTHVLVTDNGLSYTLTVSNAGPDVAPTVTVSDALPGWHSGATGSAVITGAQAGESCSFGSTVTCTLKDVGVSSRTITITVTRPITDGSYTNTATVSTPDAIDTVPGNNSGTAQIVVDPIADVTITGITASPSPVKVGVPLTITDALRNNGPSAASGVVVYHTVDTTKVSYVPNSVSISGGGGATCSYQASFAAGPYAGSAGIQCTGFSMGDATTRSLSFQVVPVYPYPGAPPFPANYDSDASISTTTFESDAANNTATNTASVTIQAVDLSVSEVDTGYDPTAFGDSIVYSVKAQNNGPSLATGFQLSVTPTAASGGSPLAYTMPFDAAGSTLPGGSTCSQPGGAGTAVVCWLGASRAASSLAASTNQTWLLKFGTGPVPDDSLPGSVTYQIATSVTSYEADAGYDSAPGNNSAIETTTVLPKTDLAVVSKSADKATVSVNEPFVYTIVVANYGPSAAPGVTVTDVLPAGLVLNGSVTATGGAGVALTTNSCSGTGTPVTVTCSLSPLPVAANASDTANLVTISIPVKAPYPAYAGPFSTNLPNTATIAPLPNTSLDPTAGNNTSAAVNVQVRKSSLAGVVYTDNNRSDTLDSNATEGVGSVTVKLSGTDAYGNVLSNITVTTSTTPSGSLGNFLFDNLPPSDGSGYAIVETQPAGYYDRLEVAGSVGGTAPSTTCDGTANCSSAAAHNTISAIVLPAATAATGYLFQEYRQATVSGYVYSDLNNNGQRAASGEPGISGIGVRLTGTDYTGAAVSTTATTNGSGVFSFTVAPSQAASSYTLTEQSQPSGYYDGSEQNGAGVVVASTAGRAAPEDLVVGQVDPNGSYTERDFGELAAVSIAGAVFVDTNGDGAKQGGETGGVPGVTITLSGTDYLGQDVCTSWPSQVPSCTYTSNASGALSLPGLPPGTYALVETAPAGLTHTGAQAGSAGGTGGTGASALSITGVTLAAGTAATGYNFGESGQLLSGAVYVDANGNGVRDGSERGIPGITVTLSGLTTGGGDVCAAIAPNPCSVTTASDGTFSYPAIPASDATGYTLAEQSQATSPLSNYADGADAVGTVGGTTTGTTTSDRFDGIVIAVGQSGAGYTFGERGSSLAGVAFLDTNNDGTQQGGENPLAGVTVTLSGTSTAGTNVCTLLASCTASTAADGTYSFTSLPSGTYTLTETQPGGYTDGREGAGSPAGTVNNGSFGGTAATNRVQNIALGVAASGTGYTFAERAAALSGTVYHDANASGVLDAGDSGIAGVTLTLSGTDAGGGAVNLSTTSAADGTYAFADVPIANGSGYLLVETQPGGWLDGRTAKGLLNGATCAPCNNSTANRVSAIPLAAGSTFTAFDFGEVNATTLSGRAYQDLDGNAQYDAGEALAGVTITATGTDDLGAAVNRTATTAVDGTYSFTGLRPSNGTGYTLTETQPTGLGDFTGATGTVVGTAGGTAALNAASGIVLASGATGTGYDFRDLAANLAGQVFLDADGNGAFGAGDTALAGVTLTLSGGASATTTTAADGTFRFDGLRAGTYTIVETQPVQYQNGTETAGTLGGTASANRVASIVVAAGQSGTGYRFAERTANASLAGTVYVDANRNGANDAGDTALAGVTVTLSGTTDNGTDVCTQLASCTATTAANGTYVFTGVLSGTYTLTESQPAGLANFSGTTGSLVGTAGGTAAVDAVGGIVLGGGVSATGYDFREQAATLSGLVYVDANRSGTYDAGDTPLVGVTVALSGASSATTASAADGSYAFTGLRPGAYTITETQPTRYQDGGASAGTLGGTVTTNQIDGIVVGAGATGANYRFAEQAGAGSLAGAVYVDQNEDGVRQGGEPGLAGVTITLSGTTLDGADICTVLASCTATTGAGGAFQLTGLLPGVYTLTETQPVAYGDGAESAGAPAGTVNAGAFGAGAATNRIASITLAADAAGSGYDFGERTGALAGRVYADMNADGTFQSGEPGIAGVSLRLTGTDVLGAAVDVSTTTAADGTYRFTGLLTANAAGYAVTETQPSGWLDGRVSRGLVDGAACAGCDLSVANRNGAIPLQPDRVYTGFDFAEAHGTALAGRVYQDLDGNGTLDAGEALAGVTVVLSGDDDLGAAVNLTTTTAADGSYGFLSLRPSSATGYTLTEQQPTGLADFTGSTGTSVGTTGGVAAANAVAGIVLGSGAAGSGYDFRDRAASLAGSVFLDANRDGVAQAGETGIGGVTIALSGDATATTTTAADGTFRFTGLRAGTYVLTESPPPQYQHGGESAGSLGGTVGTHQVAAIVVTAGAAGTAYRFAEQLGNASLSGRAYVDANRDGAPQAGEAGLAGVTVTLSGTTATGVDACTLRASCTAVTAADGTYTFLDLLAGTYSLVESQPPAYGQGGTTAGSAGGTVASADHVASIALGAGVVATGYEFGERTGTLTGRVYDDRNANSVYDAGDAGIAGVALHLTGTDLPGNAVDVPATTAADGTYSISGLLAANSAGYAIVETQPTGWLDARTAKGLVDGAVCAACDVATANRIGAIALHPDRAYTAFDFGEAHGTSVAGQVFVDVDGDGAAGANEGLAGVTLALTGTDDLGAAVNVATTTGADGHYAFTALRPSNAAGYTLTETQPADYGEFPAGTHVGSAGGTATGDVVAGIVLGSGVEGTAYDFRERAASLRGSVWLDANGDGRVDAGEAGLAGVVLAIAGTRADGSDACTGAAQCTATTAADGTFAFAGLPAGRYTITETQPLLYEDGREIAGTLGGTVDVSAFDVTPAQNRIAGIDVPAAATGDGYLFGERRGLAATVSGTVWYDSTALDRVQQPGEPGLPGWIVEVLRDGSVVASATTDADGRYTVTGVPAGTGYDLRFRNPANSVIYGNPVSALPGVVASGGMLRGLTFASGANLVEQSLPVDPSGVVYDSVTRRPLAGARVQLSGPAGFDAATHLVGGAANLDQRTGDNGFYQFLLLPGAPSGTYQIAVVPPAGYMPGTSVMLPPAAGVLDPGAGPGNFLVQPQATPPTGAQATTYYLRVSLGAGKADVVNDHIPVDPILEGAIVVTNTTPRVDVKRGELVPYTITATNQIAATLPDVSLLDLIPPAFRYRVRSAVLDGVPVEPALAGRTLTWPRLTFAPNERRTIQLLLAVGAGVGEGEYSASVHAINAVVGATVSNTAVATVRVVPDPTFDCTDVIGRVYLDLDANGRPDDGEPGVGGVRLVSPRGLVTTTDAAGRYHVACADVPQADHGSNFVLKLDARSLPLAHHLTTPNPGDVRLTRGLVAKLDFGVAANGVRVLRLDAMDFVPGRPELVPGLLARLPTLLRGDGDAPQEPTVLRIVLIDATASLARERLAAAEAAVRAAWPGPTPPQVVTEWSER